MMPRRTPKRNRLFLTLFVLYFTLPRGLAEPDQKIPNDFRHKEGTQHAVTEDLGGVKSVYTPILLELLQKWPPAGVTYPEPKANPVQIECIETPGQKDYIGLQQSLWIDAPLSTVSSILDDVAHYRDLFPGYDEIHVKSRDGNRFLVFWEQHIPLFFIPNVKYDVAYLVEKAEKNRAVYRYQLVSGKTLKKDDGIIVLEEVKSETGTPLRTRYTEYDFYDADWGILSTDKAWSESTEGIYLSDVAIKLKAEHPAWNYKQIAEEGKNTLEKYPLASVLKNKVSSVQKFKELLSKKSAAENLPPKK